MASESPSALTTESESSGRNNDTVAADAAPSLEPDNKDSESDNVQNPESGNDSDSVHVENLVASPIQGSYGAREAQSPSLSANADGTEGKNSTTNTLAGVAQASDATAGLELGNGADQDDNGRRVAAQTQTQKETTGVQEPSASANSDCWPSSGAKAGACEASRDVYPSPEISRDRDESTASPPGDDENQDRQTEAGAFDFGMYLMPANDSVDTVSMLASLPLVCAAMHLVRLWSVAYGCACRERVSNCACMRVYESSHRVYVLFESIIYMYIYIYVIYACIIRICTCMHMHICIYIYMYVCMYVCMYVRMYIY
jgi:hypothetical protein